MTIKKIKSSYGMLGKKHSQETRNKIRETHLKNKKNVGKHHSPNTQFKKGQKPWNTGIKGDEYFSHLKDGKVWNKCVTGYKVHTEKHKEELRKSMTGNKYREGKEPWNKGAKGLYKSPKSPEVRKRISDSLKGHPCYKDKERGRNISKANKGRKLWANRDPPMLGRKQTGKFKKMRSKQKLPLKDSSIELKIQDFLTLLEVEFVTHKYMNIKHAYQCDILIPVQDRISQKTIIECDGDFFHMNPKKYSANDKCFKMVAKDRWKLDESRTKELIKDGYRVIRIWENKIKVMSIDDLKEKIMEVKI